MLTSDDSKKFKHVKLLLETFDTTDISFFLYLIGNIEESNSDLKNM